MRRTKGVLTTPKLICLPMGPGKLLRNSFRCQKTQNRPCAMPHAAQQDKRCPGRSAPAIKVAIDHNLPHRTGSLPAPLQLPHGPHVHRSPRHREIKRRRLTVAKIVRPTPAQAQASKPSYNTRQVRGVRRGRCLPGGRWQGGACNQFVPPSRTWRSPCQRRNSQSRSTA